MKYIHSVLFLLISLTNCKGQPTKNIENKYIYMYQVGFMRDKSYAPLIIHPSSGNFDGLKKQSPFVYAIDMHTFSELELFIKSYYDSIEIKEQQINRKCHFCYCISIKSDSSKIVEYVTVNDNENNNYFKALIAILDKTGKNIEIIKDIKNRIRLKE